MSSSGRDRVGQVGGGDRVEPIDRVAAVRTLLEEAGIQGKVTAAGMDGEIAAVRGAPALRKDLERLAPEIRLLGFRYIALEPCEATYENEDS